MAGGVLDGQAVVITGQLIRFTGDQLHIVRQPGIKDPVLRRAGWETEDIAEAFESVLDRYLDPFGLEKRALPRLGTTTP